jgi:hypothetical protein
VNIKYWNRCLKRDSKKQLSNRHLPKCPMFWVAERHMSRDTNAIFISNSVREINKEISLNVQAGILVLTCVCVDCQKATTTPVSNNRISESKNAGDAKPSSGNQTNWMMKKFKQNTLKMPPKIIHSCGQVTRRPCESLYYIDTTLVDVSKNQHLARDVEKRNLRTTTRVKKKKEKCCTNCFNNKPTCATITASLFFFF